MATPLLLPAEKLVGQVASAVLEAQEGQQLSSRSWLTFL